MISAGDFRNGITIELNSFDLVGGQRDANPCATDQDSAVGLAIRHCASYFLAIHYLYRCVRRQLCRNSYRADKADSSQRGDTNCA